MRQPSAQHGFSLIELLVTVVIFSIGLLGAAGLQIVSKRATFAAMQRTTATQVASGLLQDMRANGPALATYVATAQIGQQSVTGVSSADCTNTNNTCTATEVSLRDLKSWEILMDGDMEASPDGSVGGLVSPVACIAGPVDGSAGVYVVSVAWRGAVAIADAGIIDCGANSGQYGDANEFRRVIQILTFIDPNI
ncbi:MAG: type IV pilus modification protein PilV [Proteobacteria bacterium]|nr:type IV pilus modification protein PilV [Pseudomonadota bacterium]